MASLWANSLWANKAFIARIIRRFQLEGQRREPENPLFLPFILPVTSVDEVLRKYVVELSYPTADPGAVGQYAIMTVPTGKRRAVQFVQVARVAGTTLLITGLYVTNAAGVTCVVMWQTGTSSLYKEFHTPVVLEQGDKIEVYISAWLAGDTMRGNVYYSEEDAF